MTQSTLARNWRAPFAFAAAFLLAVLPFATTSADLASAKAIVDAAKLRGEVGEQGDGYLGFVSQQSDPQVAAAMAEINAGRASVYQDAAAKTGVSPSAAGEAAASQLFKMIPPGQYYKPAGGTWTKK
jgi:uncharacterized protein YdbL (DUF1318 family)